MRPITKFGLLLFSGLSVVAARAQAQPQNVVFPSAQSRSILSFDADWRFLKSDAPGAEKPAFADAPWRRLNVPHDWSIEGPFSQNNPTGGAGGFLPGGVGWYRKSFILPMASQRKRVYIEFDGVMANSDVWINGAHLGKRPFGYVSFRYDLTPHLKFGNAAPNVLAVRADNSAQPASRWYSGAGIYRHVRLCVTDAVHIEGWSTFVTTPRISSNSATVQVKNTVINQSQAPRLVALQVTLIDGAGKAVGSVTSQPQTVAAGQSVDFSQSLTVLNPRIWDISRPQLYRAVSRVRSGNAVIDEASTPFGIRHFEFVPTTGFWLNGRNFKLKGVCLHHDAGAFGAAVPLRAWKRRLEVLKSLGVNSIRTAHNPVAPEFLDLCDRMGFLVMDELFDAWTVSKNPHDYHLFFKEWANIDVRDTVMRDRNHPSIILYSAGNEIHDTPDAELAKGILKELVATFHRYDPTRPVTQALFRPNVSHDYENGLADILDVVGQNYRPAEILAAHTQKPTRKIVGTENGHDRANWMALRDNPPYSGQFLWVGIDYLGESRQWPRMSSGSGLLDRTATPRPLGFQRQSWWSDAPMVYISRRVAPSAAPAIDPGYPALAAPNATVPNATVPTPNTPATPAPNRARVLFSDWTPQNTAPHLENVEVYSNCEQVELFLNGQSLGAKALPADAGSRNWPVPFAAGTLRAVATNGAVVVATHELKTAGAPAKIVLNADINRLAPIWDDVSTMTATIVDANGVPVPDASHLITFRIAGPGMIAAVDNGDNASHEAFQATQRSAYQGQCFAMVKASAAKGRITLTAASPGLSSAAITVDAVSPK